MTTYFDLIVAIPIWYVCLLGLGNILALVTRQDNGLTAPLLTSYGLAVLITIGGVLNLLSLISIPSLIFVYGVGAIFGISYIRKKIQSIDFAWFLKEYTIQHWILFAFVLLFFVLKILSIDSIEFNGHDDFHAYLAFPEQMLTTGSIEEQPFSERRLTSYGAQSFLHSFSMVIIENSLLHGMDGGLCLIIFCTLLLSHCNSAGVKKHLTALIFLSTIIIAPDILQQPMNITSQYSGMVLLYSLLLSLARLNKTSNIQNFIVCGVIAAAIIALKHSYMVWVLISPVIFLLLSRQLPISKRVNHCFIYFTVIVIVLSPWMYAMYKSNHTLLYPLLGTGTFGSSYGFFTRSQIGSPDFRTVITQTINTFSYPVCFVVLVLLLGAIKDKLIFHDKLLIGFLGTTISVICMIVFGILIIVTPSLDQSVSEQYRFAVPLLYGSATYLLVQTAAVYNADLQKTKVIGVSLFCAIGLLAGSYLRDSTFFYYYQIAGLNKPSNFANLREGQPDLRAIQNSVPESETIFTRVDRPFNLDFKRKNILINDWPCASSLPPGLPCNDHPEALANYLRSHNIRYLMYSYQNKANFSEAEFGHRIAPNGKGKIARVHLWAKYTFWMQNSLLKLSKAYPVLSDNGHSLVIDIGKNGF
jgi:hypothetical protein